jgi:hypothetical protein
LLGCFLWKGLRRDMIVLNMLMTLVFKASTLGVGPYAGPALEGVFACVWALTGNEKSR